MIPIWNPVRASQIRAVPSATAAATRIPLGLKTASAIELPGSGPRRTRINRSVTVDQTLTTPSWLQVRNDDPFGLKEAQWTSPLWSSRFTSKPVRSEYIRA